jgi:hypothetical protein
LACDEPPRYRRRLKGSIVDAVEPEIRVLLSRFPDMPATVIAERIGWGRGKTVLCDRIARLRPLYRVPGPAQRTDYLPGELAQCDLWFPAVDVPLGWGQFGRPPVLVMVCGYSRWMSAVMIPSRQGPDLLAGQWQLIAGLGAAPKALVWDNESAVGKWRGGRPQLTEAMNAFRGMLGIAVVQCRPADPEAKGLTERNNGFLETSFLPGRRFTSPADFNAQLAGFLNLANARKRRALQGASAHDRVGADRAAMVPLPPIDPATIGWRNSLMLPRDHYVRLDTCDYSVHPGAIGQRVEVIADLDTLRIRRGGVVVGEHTRCWARQQTITDAEHRKAADAMRQAFQNRSASGRGPTVDEVQERDLSAYDRAFGLDDDEQAA